MPCSLLRRIQSDLPACASDVPESACAGPQIIVLSPQEGDTVTAPFDLDVRFLASPDAHIAADPQRRSEENAVGRRCDGTHQAIYRCGWHPYDADFPKGHHTVTLQIADERGCMTSKTVTMDVQ